MDTVGYVLSFVGGCLVGAVATYRLATDKAEERADLEIAEMERYFEAKIESQKKKLSKVDDSVKKKAEASRNKPNPAELKKKAEEAAVNYTAYSEEPAPSDIQIHSVEPVILQNEDEFGEIEEYNREYWTLYADDILVDNVTRMVIDRNEMLDTIGQKYVDELDKLTGDGMPRNVTWVRNDRYRTYYEIERSYDEYSAVGWEDDEEYR